MREKPASHWLSISLSTTSPPQPPVDTLKRHEKEEGISISKTTALSEPAVSVEEEEEEEKEEEEEEWESASRGSTRVLLLLLSHRRRGSVHPQDADEEEDEGGWELCFLPRGSD